MFARPLPPNPAPFWLRLWHYRKLMQWGRIGGERDGADRFGEPYQSLFGETW